MNLKVIAEGVETARQVERLLEFGCEYGQGYYFSQPLEAKAALSLCSSPWLRRQERGKRLLEFSEPAVSTVPLPLLLDIHVIRCSGISKVEQPIVVEVAYGDFGSGNAAWAGHHLLGLERAVPIAQ
jgi:hypothetical protein